MPGLDFTAIIAIEGEPTGDGRMLEKGALVFESGPWPLRFRREGDHDGIVVGTVTEVWRSGAEIRAKGYLHTETADEIVLLAVTRVIELSNEKLAGISVGLDDEDVEVRIKASLLKEINEELAEDPPQVEPESEPDADGRVVVYSWSSGDELTVLTSGRLREVTVTDQPAIVGTHLDVKAAIAASSFASTGTGLEIVATPIVAAARKSAFANPNFGPDGDHDPRLVWQAPKRPEEVGGWGCPLTVEDDGRIYGHLATKGRCHGAYSACVNPPDSGGDFSMFLTGEAERGIPTGPIILGTTHSVNPDGTIKSYDHLANTGEAVADVTVGNDQHGTWVAGRLRPGVTEEQIAALRGSALSGEWLPYGSNLRLAGILAVNSPGYLVQRVKKDAYGLAAALYTVGPTCCGEDPTEKRIETLEAALAASLMRGV